MLISIMNLLKSTLSYMKIAFISLQLIFSFGIILNRQFNNTKNNMSQDNKQLFTFPLPFLGPNLVKLFNQFQPDIKLQFVSTTPSHIGSFFKSKDHFPSSLCSNVIYKFTCSSCKATYYGKTNRNLLTRYREHLGINKYGQNIQSESSSSIKDHANKTGHAVSIDDFTILCKSNNAFDHLIYEILLIHTDRPSLTFQQSSIPLNLF